MRYDWKRMLLGAILVAGCGSGGQGSTTGPSGPAAAGGQILARTDGGHFAVIEGELSDLQPLALHRLSLDPTLFRLPSGVVTFNVKVEQERGKSIQLRLTDTSKGQPVALEDGLQIRARLGEVLEVQVSGSGDYRLLVSLAGDTDGDGDVDAADGPAVGENLGVSTLVRPLQLHFALAPGPEPLAGIQESLDTTAHFVGQASPGATVVIQPLGLVQAKASPIPVTLSPTNSFAFSAPLVAGENAFSAIATDSFGQQAEAAAQVDQVAQTSETLESMSEDKKNRIWLLDVHANNYLFRGPLPLTSLEETGRVDFASLIEVMNERLEKQGAPITTLPQEFDFTEISLIGNRATTSSSHGDEGNSLYLIYQSILGGTPARPVADEQDPTSLYTRPLDNSATEGPAFTQVVKGKTYTIHPSVVWQPTSANPTGQEPSTVPDGAGGYATIVRSTFPIVSIAPDLAQPLRALTNPLSNVSVVAHTLHQLMEQDHSQGRLHVYYFHCVNGHDRTGMAATAYVLSARGPSFNYDLATAYKYGQMGTYLEASLPAGIDKERNIWDKLEEDNKKTGRLKSKYMQAVQALAFLYYHPPASGIQEAPPLTRNAPSVPLWEAGYPFAPSAGVPTLATPPDYVHVRAAP